MPLKGLQLLLVFSVGLVLTSIAQEYPFIQYTPKDGLINGRIRNVYQDTKGRLFFMTANGLSVYDGARFNNYGFEDGLGNPVVNDMLEISPDSILLATNTNELNAWVRGKIKKIETADGYCPVINKFLRARDGNIYVATDEGIHSFQQNRFDRIDVKNPPHYEQYISFDDIQELGEYLLVRENFEMTKTYGLYLVDKNKKKSIPLIDASFSTVIQIPRYNVLICASVQEKLRTFDLRAASSGIVKEVPLPPVYQALEKLHITSLDIDKKGNLWCLNLNSIVKISPEGNVLVYDKTTGLDVNNINGVFLDRENVLWIHTDGSGLIKLANDNVEIVTGLFSESATGISAVYASPLSDTTWLFNNQDHTLYSSTADGILRYPVYPPLNASHLIKEDDHFYLFDYGKIYVAKRIPNKQGFAASLYLQMEKGSIANLNRAILHNHYLYAPGPEIVVIKNGQIVFSLKVPLYNDQIAIDKRNRLWVAPRAGGLQCYTIHPEEPDNFLQFYHNYKNSIPALNTRSLTIDTNDRVWVGTRYDGLYCFQVKDTNVVSQTHFTVHEGLTDNFIYFLTCDMKNNIWVGSQSGLDKISHENGNYIVEGVTRNNNIFQLIQSIFISKTNQVWTFGNSGSVLRISNNPNPIEYLPQLQIGRIKTTDTSFDIPSNGLRLPYYQNNITFEVAAPSFIDEKQILFSYVLEGSDNNKWSTPSRQATLNFINLPHGNYRLKIKATFPVSSYAPQELVYAFTITPPWWDTWWSKLLMIAGFVGIIVMAIRFYYQRKLQKQKILFEKQQAVEQERTRIAMEMHDDLGSGLTTIRYLAGGLSLQAENSSKDKADKIATSAKSLVDNMNDIIWTMKSDNNTLTEALAYIRKQAAEQLETAGIDYHIEFPKELPDIKLSNDLKRNLLLISKEAIHNIVKHSAATSVSLTAHLDTGKIQLRIIDNGKGIDLKDISKFGNGLKSMRKRAEEIKALLEIMNSKGTTIVVTAPVV